MSQAKQGDSVKIHYTGKLEDGEVFATSVNRGPLEFTIGEGKALPGFEEAVCGMAPGETKIFDMPSGKAYGPYRGEKVVKVSRDRLLQDLKPEVDEQLRVTTSDGAKKLVTVTEVTDSSVTLDANHPLAGKNLVFELQLLEVR